MEFYFGGRVLNLGGSACRRDLNIDAIQLLRHLDEEQREPTQAEQWDLAHYTGWGDAAVAKDLRRAGLTGEELESANGSTLNAHYTSQTVIDAIWSGLDLDSVKAVLDPSAGLGHFKSGAPGHIRAAKWVECELDLVTGSILKSLHPESTVLVQGFETVNLPEGYFDLAISNFPFGKYQVADSRYKRFPFLRSAIHNYFFARSLDLVRPGGLVVAITSRFTLDAMDGEVRKYLAERVELLAACRLPGGDRGAFQANAGTPVTTDILVLRKRQEKVGFNDGDGANWTHAYYFKYLRTEASYYGRPYTSEVMVPINQHYHEHPEHVLGTPAMTGTMYGPEGYQVEADGRDLGTAICNSLRQQLCDHRPLLVAPVVHVEVAPATIRAVPEPEPENPIARELLKIFDLAKGLLKADADGGSVEAAILRERLNQAYDTFVQAHGPLIQHVKRLGSDAPQAPFLLALVKPNGSKADLFSGSVVRSIRRIEKPTVTEAYTMCLNALGKVDIATIALSSGVDETTAIYELNGLVYQDKPGHYIAAEEYLSGDVKTKLAQAQAFAAVDSSFVSNVEALLKVQPPDKGPGQIKARLGAAWIPAAVIESFLRHLVDERFVVFHSPYQNKWDVRAKDKYLEYRFSSNPDIVQKWGTHRLFANEIVEHMLNGQQIVIKDRVDDDTYIVNQTETIAAQVKAEAIAEEFQKWVWQSSHADELVRIYNDKLNRHALRHYDGQHLELPGLSDAFVPYESQQAAVWRVLQSQTTLVDHEVGMGKTLVATISAMEAIRMGLAHKAMIVVPNHTVAGKKGWETTIRRAYPGCNLLVATKDTLNQKKRPEFMARVATGTWDIVLVPFSSFKLLNVSDDTLAAQIDKEITTVRGYIDDLNAESGKSGSVRAEKGLQRTLKTLEARRENLFKDVDRDSGETITWEELGVDMLMVDEVHEFKKLQFHTKMGRIAGLGSGDGSQMAYDLYVKAMWLLDKGGKFVGMSGTPLTNTIAEVYTWQRFFGRETLEAVGLSHFDSWFSTFAVSESALEMTPDGSGFRMHTRVRKFVNVRELSMLWSQFCDHRVMVKGGEIERPDLFLGKGAKVTTDGGPELKAYIQTLAERVERIRGDNVDPHDDNMLKITSDGRKAAIKPKMGRLAQVVSEIYHLTESAKATQLVFLDIGTPKGKKNDRAVEDDDEVLTESESIFLADAYNNIRARLLTLGVKADDVAFIHDCKNNEQKTKLYADVNAGQVRILIGSTGKMGTGVNVQERLIALHHVDPTYRPDQIEQRRGRMWRQGNIWPTVFEFVHVTTGSFDGYMWQLLEMKAGFRHQFASASGIDEVEDISETVLSYGEIKGIASGNPLVMERVVVANDVTRLDALRISHEHSLWRARLDEASLESAIRATEDRVTAYKAALPIPKQEKFSVTLTFPGGKSATYDDREKAGHTLKGLLASVEHGTEIGEYRGFKLSRGNQPIALRCSCPNVDFVDVSKLEAAGIFQSLDYHMRILPDDLVKAEGHLVDMRKRIAQVETAQNVAFEFEEQLAVVKSRLSEIDGQLKESEKQAAVAAAEGLVQANQIEIDDTDLLAAMEEIKRVVATYQSAPIVEVVAKPVVAAPPAPVVVMPTVSVVPPAGPKPKFKDIVVKPKRKADPDKVIVQTGFTFAF